MQHPEDGRPLEHEAVLANVFKKVHADPKTLEDLHAEYTDSVVDNFYDRIFSL